MIEMIKEIGIFIVIAQALLYFVPGEAYAKYVKVVIGIAMIAKLADPVLSLITENTTDALLEEALRQSFSFAGQSEDSPYDHTEENGQEFLLSAIEEELTDRLQENSAQGYDVQDVLVKGNSSGEIQGIVVVVSACSGERNQIQIEKVTVNQEKEGKILKKEEDERLKNYYGTILEIPPEQIEICLK